MTQPDKLSREEIAEAIYNSQKSYIGGMKDCLVAADAVLALQASKQSEIDHLNLLTGIRE